MLKKTLLGILPVLMIVFGAGRPALAQSPPDHVPAAAAPAAHLFPVLQRHKMGYIDRTGRLVIPCRFGYAQDFSEGLAAVESKDHYGYIDPAGRFVIPPRFDSAGPFSEGLAVAAIRRHDRQGRVTLNRFGYIDRSGRLVIEPRDVVAPQWLSPFAEGLACVLQVDKIGYIDKTGQMVIPAQYVDAHPFSEGLAAVTVDNKYGYIDRSGKMVIAPQFDDVGPFTEGLAGVVTGGKPGFIDKTGALVIKGEDFVDARGFSDGLAAAVGANGRYGYLDRTGRFAIPPQFHHAGDFHEGLAAVNPAGAEWPGDLAYIDKTGRVVITSMSTLPNRPMKSEFDLRHYRFRDGLARVGLGLGEGSDDPLCDAEGYINREGKLIWPKVPPSREDLRY